MFAENYAKYYDRLNLGKPYKEEIEFVYKWAGSPRSILDLGCGTASYWKYFPSNITVNGIERSMDMINLSEHRKRIIKTDIRVINFSVLNPFDCVTALFDVVNYVDTLTWMKDLPLKPGKFFIFDIFDYEKVKADGFKKTERQVEGVKRTIRPISENPRQVKLGIEVKENGALVKEIHELFLWSDDDIEKASNDCFDIVETKQTENWQKWYKLRKR